MQVVPALAPAPAVELRQHGKQDLRTRPGAWSTPGRGGPGSCQQTSGLYSNGCPPSRSAWPCSAQPPPPGKSGSLRKTHGPSGRVAVRRAGELAVDRVHLGVVLEPPPVVLPRLRREPLRRRLHTRFSSSSSVKNAPCEQQPSSPRPSMMPWQPRPKMHVHRDSSQVRSARMRCSGFAGSANSIHSRGKSSCTSRLRGPPVRSASSSASRVICTGRGTSARRSARGWRLIAQEYARVAYGGTTCHPSGAPRLNGMRLGVLDVGSNTVHLLVVDAHRGAHPWPAYSEKSVLRLAERIGPDGRLDSVAADELVEGGGRRAARGRAARRRRPARVRHVGGARRHQLGRGAGPGAGGDRSRAAGALRRRTRRG